MTQDMLFVAVHSDAQHPRRAAGARADAPESTGGVLFVPGASLALHPRLRLVYSVSGTERGTLHSWSFEGRLDLLSSTDSGGEEPCHVAVDPLGQVLIITNYASGNLAVFELDDDGTPQRRPQLVRLEGSGPLKARQGSAHPHQVVFAPDGRHLLVMDLGADVLRLFTLDRTSCRVHGNGTYPVTPGTGPRHAVVTHDGAVVVTGELSQTVLSGAIDWTTTEMTGWHVLPATQRPTTHGPNYPGHIVVDEHERVVHVANRGHDTISSFSLRSGQLQFIGEVDAGGSWPQHMVLADGALLVAARDSSVVVRLELDQGTGAVLDGAPTTLLRASRPGWLLHLLQPEGW